jgi:hypothetical protein
LWWERERRYVRTEKGKKALPFLEENDPQKRFFL